MEHSSVTSLDIAKMDCYIGTSHLDDPSYQEMSYPWRYNSIEEIKELKRAVYKDIPPKEKDIEIIKLYQRIFVDEFSEIQRNFRLYAKLNQILPILAKGKKFAVEDVFDEKPDAFEEFYGFWSHSLHKDEEGKVYSFPHPIKPLHAIIAKSIDHRDIYWDPELSDGEMIDGARKIIQDAIKIHNISYISAVFLHLDTVKDDAEEVKRCARFMSDCDVGKAFWHPFLKRSLSEDVKYSIDDLRIFFHIAINNDDSQSAKLLLDAGVNFHAPAKTNNSSFLHIAIRHSNTIAEMLIKEGANPFFRNDDGETPIDYAIKEKKWNLLDRLIAKLPLDASLKEGLRKIDHLLLQACKKDDLDGCMELSRSHVELNVNVVGILGETPLTTACVNQSEEIVKWLLDQKADPNLCNSKGNLPLYLAANGKKFSKLIDLLLNSGADVNLPSKRKDGTGSFFHDCISERHLPLVKRCLALGGDPKSSYEFDEQHYGSGSTVILHPLYAPLIMNDEPLIEELVNAGASVTEKCRGFPLLFLALKNASDRIVQLFFSKGARLSELTNPFYIDDILPYLAARTNLLEDFLKNGLDLTWTTRKNETLLHLLLNLGKEEAANRLIEEGIDVHALNDDDENALYIASKMGLAKSVKQLLSLKCDPNIYNTYGSNCLAIAYDNDHREVMNILSESGAKLVFAMWYSALLKDDKKMADRLLKMEDSVDKTTYNGIPLLHFLVYKQIYSFMKYCLALNLDVNQSDSKKAWTPLHFVSSLPDLRMVKTLLKHRANVNFTSNAGITPLMIAVKQDSLEIVRLLIKEKANTKIKDKDGWSLMHYASAVSNSQCLPLLIRLGCDVNCKQIEGLTPLHYACAMGHFQNVKKLVRAGANINSSYVKGFTPLYYAAGSNSLPIVRYLMENGASAEVIFSNKQIPGTITSSTEVRDYISLNDANFTNTIETIRGLSHRFSYSILFSVEGKRFKGKGNFSRAQNLSLTSSFKDFFDFYRDNLAMHFKEESVVKIKRAIDFFHNPQLAIDAAKKMKKEVIIPVQSGYVGHSIGLVFYYNPTLDSYMVIETNRGENSEFYGGREAPFKAIKLMPKMIAELECIVNQDDTPDDYEQYRELLQQLIVVFGEATPLFPHYPQKTGNCTHANCKGIIFKDVVYAAAIQEGMDSREAKEIANECYRKFARFDRNRELKKAVEIFNKGHLSKKITISFDSIKELINKLADNPHIDQKLVKDFRKACVSLYKKGVIRKIEK